MARAAREGVSVPPFPGDQLQLDLLTAVARLQQIADEGGFYGDGPVDLVAERLLTCDLPRLRAHLASDVVAWAEENL
jgi:hypothetical protein